MSLDLFAGLPVADFRRARDWYERFLGAEPAERVTYPGKARKAIYRDPDGNELSYGGPVATEAPG